jgi:hypothetical protein
MTTLGLKENAIFRQISAGAANAQENAIGHRNIKPDNILRAIEQYKFRGGPTTLARARICRSLASKTVSISLRGNGVVLFSDPSKAGEPTSRHIPRANLPFPSDIELFRSTSARQ